MKKIIVFIAFMAMATPAICQEQLDPNSDLIYIWETPTTQFIAINGFMPATNKFVFGSTADGSTVCLMVGDKEFARIQNFFAGDTVKTYKSGIAGLLCRATYIEEGSVIDKKYLRKIDDDVLRKFAKGLGRFKKWVMVGEEYSFVSGRYKTVIDLYGKSHTVIVPGFFNQR